MLQLCVSGMCYPPLTSEEFIFNTYKECTITGYEESLMYVGDEHRQRWLNSILANQYTMTEIADGTCWNRLKDK